MTLKKNNHSAVIWGYAFLLVFFGLFTGRVNLFFFGDRAYEIFSMYAHSAEIGQIACLFVVALFSFYRRQPTERVLPYLALGFLTLGFSLTLYQAIENTSPVFITPAAGILFGGGQGACFMGWFMVYSRMKLDEALSCMIMSTILSAFMLFGIGLIPNTTGLFSVLLLVSTGAISLLFFCLKRTSSEPVERREHDCTTGNTVYEDISGTYRRWLTEERRSLLSLIAIAFVCGAQRFVSLEGLLPQEVVSLLFPLGYAVGALVFWGLCKVYGTKRDFLSIYSTLLVVMATCGVFSAIQEVSVQTVLYAIVNIAFTVASMFMVTTALRTLERVHRSPLFLAGTICGSVYFSIQFGRMVCLFISDTVGMNATGILIVSVIIIYVVALVAISSAGSFRKANDGSFDSMKSDKDNPDQPRTVISVSQVPEKQLRENPIYRQQYGLTDRELDMLVLLLAGYNASDIATLLTISVNTVKTHLKNLYTKMGVHNRRVLIDLLNEIERNPTDTSSGLPDTLKEDSKL